MSWPSRWTPQTRTDVAELEDRVEQLEGWRGTRTETVTRVLLSPGVLFIVSPGRPARHQRCQGSGNGERRPISRRLTTDPADSAEHRGAVTPTIKRRRKPMNENAIRQSLELLQKARDILVDAWLADSAVDSAGIAMANEQLDELIAFVEGLVAPVTTSS